MKNVILTGASSGIGKATAQALAEQGYKVFALSRRATTGSTTAIGKGSLVGVAADVTSDESVQSAMDYIKGQCNSIDILINCAGNGIAGAIEDTSIDEAKWQMETNFYGTLRMINAILPIMREQKGGRIINVGSVAGIFSVPFQAFYSVSKFGIEALSEALRIECKPFNIKVTIIEPGDTKTDFTAARVYTAATAKSTPYKQQFSNAIYSMAVSEQKGKAPSTCTKAILKAIKAKNPPVRIVVGFEYKLLCFLKRLLPDRLVNNVLGGMYVNAKIKDTSKWSFDKDVLKK